MAQITDPRQGTQRQKALVRKIAQQAMQRKGYKSKVGQFGKMSQVGGQSRGLRPMRGPGNAIARAGRMGGFGNFFDGMNVGPGPGQGQGQLPGYVNTAPVAAAPPSILPGPPTGPISEAYPEGNPNVLAGTTGSDSTGTWTVPDAYNPTPPEGMSVWGTPLDGSPSLSTSMEAGSNYQQSGPSGQITAPGGLIPLGGGRYYDPASDKIFGAGGSGGMNFKAM